MGFLSKIFLVLGSSPVIGMISALAIKSILGIFQNGENYGTSDWAKWFSDNLSLMVGSLTGLAAAGMAAGVVGGPVGMVVGLILGIVAGKIVDIVGNWVGGEGWAEKLAVTLDNIADALYGWWDNLIRPFLNLFGMNIESRAEARTKEQIKKAEDRKVEIEKEIKTREEAISRGEDVEKNKGEIETYKGLHKTQDDRLKTLQDRIKPMAEADVDQDYSAMAMNEVNTGLYYWARKGVKEGYDWSKFDENAGMTHFVQSVVKSGGIDSYIDRKLAENEAAKVAVTPQIASPAPAPALTPQIATPAPDTLNAKLGALIQQQKQENPINVITQMMGRQQQAPAPTIVNSSNSSQVNNNVTQTVRTPPRDSIWQMWGSAMATGRMF